MEQDIDTTTGSSGIDRRDFIRKSAIVGGMVWAAPAMSTLGSRAFADEGTIRIEDECDNFINFKIEQDDDGNWAFVPCLTQDVPGSCVPVDYVFTGDCIPPKTGDETGVTSADGRVRLTVDGSLFTLWVEEGCEILQGGAVGGRGPDTNLDPCVFFQPNGTAQTWDATVPQGDLSNIVGFICCNDPF